MRLLKQDIVKVGKLSVNNHKILLILLKYLPVALGVEYFLATVLQYFDVEVGYLSYGFYIGLVPLIFIFVCSYVFKFCEYHRIYLYYIILNEVMNIINYNVELNITDTAFIRIHIIVFFIATLLTTILYLYGRKDKHITQFTTEGD